ncbi:MAG: sulfotransferase [Phycisphaerales bacterium]
MSDAPIILLGSHRSGTTWLGDLFRHHPALAYWEEPRHVWTWGNAYTPDDVLTEVNARPRVIAHIHKTFNKFVQEQGRQRLVEKTPSNMLRVRFIRAVYPDARLIMVVRDGRSVLRSTGEIMVGGVRLSKILYRARHTPPLEWPAFAGQTLGAITRKITGKKLAYWGPRPQGWKSWVGVDHPDVILAKQWAGCLTRALDDAEALEREGAPPILRFRYEDLLARPRETLVEICEHCDLADAESVIVHAEQTADPSRVDKWRAELDDETLVRVRPVMERVLERLGYAWEPAQTALVR